MRHLIICSIALLLAAFVSCDTADPIVDNPSDTVIPNLAFTVDTPIWIHLREGL